ncbi:MAG: hypothetical protein AAF907_18065, partial [Planctomycetota bacterium]
MSWDTLPATDLGPLAGVLVDRIAANGQPETQQLFATTCVARWHDLDDAARQRLIDAIPRTVLIGAAEDLLKTAAPPHDAAAALAADLADPDAIRLAARSLAGAGRREGDRAADLVESVFRGVAAGRLIPGDSVLAAAVDLIEGFEKHGRRELLPRIVELAASVTASGRASPAASELSTLLSDP